MWRHARRRRASSPCGGPRHHRASHPTVGAHSCSTRVQGSRRQACRKARRCRAELHREWHLAMAEARFCSTRRQGSRRKGLLFGLRRRSPKGPRRALRRPAEVRFCSTRVRELPRMGFLFSLRHHAPRRASHQLVDQQLRRAHQKQTSAPTVAKPAAGGRASARRRRRRRRGNPNTNRTRSTTPSRSCQIPNLQNQNRWAAARPGP